jgi:hypothetical protein
MHWNWDKDVKPADGSPNPGEGGSEAETLGKKFDELKSKDIVKKLVEASKVCGDGAGPDKTPNLPDALIGDWPERAKRIYAKVSMVRLMQKAMPESVTDDILGDLIVDLSTAVFLGNEAYRNRKGMAEPGAPEELKEITSKLNDVRTGDEAETELAKHVDSCGQSGSALEVDISVLKKHPGCPIERQKVSHMALVAGHLDAAEEFAKCVARATGEKIQSMIADAEKLGAKVEKRIDTIPD